MRIINNNDHHVSFRQIRRRRCLILFGVSVLVWLTGAWGGFVWIDHVEIEQAGYRVTDWEDFQLVWSVSLDAYLERESGSLQSIGGYYRPIYAMFVTADWALWGSKPFPYHLVNISVHALVVVFLYLLGTQLLASIRIGNTIAFAGTLLFAVHPFGVHSVTWISGRKDSLCALFAVAALIGFGRLLLRQERSSFRVATVLVSVLLLNVATLCKELAVVVPVFATIWVWFALGKNDHQSSSQPTARSFDTFVLLGLFWISSIGAIAFRKWNLGGIGLDVPYPSDSFVTNALVSVQLVGTYVQRTLLPLDPTIVDRWPVEIIGGTTGVLAALAFLGILSVMIWGLVRRRIEGLFACWFCIWLLPATGIVPLRHMYAERYLYPASWGLMLLACLLVSRWFERESTHRQTTIWFASPLAILFSVQTIIANQSWKSDQSLFRYAVLQDEHYAEGLSALALIELEEKKYDSSAAFSKRAIESANDETHRSYWSRFGTLSNAGLASYYVGDSGTARTMFELARDSRPANAISWYHLGLVAKAENDLDAAANYYRRAIEQKADHHLSRNNLGHIYLVLQQFDECVSVLKCTVDAQPSNSLALANIATAYLLRKDFSAAEQYFEIVVALDSGDAIDLAKLAWSEFEQDKGSEAKLHLAEARRIAPTDPTVLYVEQAFGGD